MIIGRRLLLFTIIILIDICLCTIEMYSAVASTPIRVTIFLHALLQLEVPRESYNSIIIKNIKRKS